MMNLRKKNLAPRFETLPVLTGRGFVRVAYTEWGPTTSDQTVICAHGLTRNSRDFDFLAHYLAQRGMRVIAPDLPGRGRSEWLTRPMDYTTPTYLTVMAALLARLDVPEVDWVGTSLGGHIGMELAAQPGAPIRRLVLNDFGARLQGAALNRLANYVRLNQRYRSIDELEQYFRTVYSPFGPLTDGQWRHMAEHSATLGNDGVYRQNYDPTISNYFIWPSILDIALWHVWDKVDCPVLILRGETSDLLMPSTVTRMKSRGSAAQKGLVESVEIPDCGHAPSLMALEQMQIVEEFLVRDEAKVEAKRA